MKEFKAKTLKELAILEFESIPRMSDRILLEMIADVLIIIELKINKNKPKK